MSKQRVTIHFENAEVWKDQTENVNQVLEKHTGKSQYPMTRSLPPSIFGPELTTEAIEELNALDGVSVRT